MSFFVVSSYDAVKSVFLLLTGMLNSTPHEKCRNLTKSPGLGKRRDRKEAAVTGTKKLDTFFPDVVSNHLFAVMIFGIWNVGL